MRGKELADRVAEAYRLRRWYLSAMGGGVTDPRDGAVLAQAPVRAWRLLLASECCALPLGRILRTRGLATELSAAARNVIDAAERAEMQRVLAARSVIALLDRTAREVDVRVVVLKGGVAVAEQGWEPLDLGDVDILVDRKEAEPLWNALLVNGWQQDGNVTIPFAEMARHNWFPSLRPDVVDFRVDFHRRSDVGRLPPASVRSLGGFAALDRQVGTEVTVSLLRHSVSAHPFRRGHLRDLHLIAQFVRELRPDERLAVAKVIERDAYHSELAALFEQVSAVADGRSPSDSPSVVRFILWKYVQNLRTARSIANQLPAWRALSLVALERPEIRWARFKGELRSVLHTSPRSPEMRTASHLRHFPGPVMLTLRAGYRLALLAGAAVGGPVIRARMASLDPSTQSRE